MSKKVILYTAYFLFFSCTFQEQKDANDNEENPPADLYVFKHYNYCSPNLVFDDHVYGNVIVEATPSGNFLKCTAVSDSEFVFSCGRGKKEVVFFKTECGYANYIYFDGLKLPKLRYDDEELMILYLKSGSDSWSDYFVFLPRNTVYTEQASYIDTVYRKYVYLDASDYENQNVLFIVHSIMPDTRDTIKSNYYKFRDGGFPSLFIRDVSISNDTLFYSVESDNGLARDTIVY